MWETISPSEEKYLKHIDKQSNVYNNEIRIVINAPEHFHNTRQKLNFKQPQIQGMSNSIKLLLNRAKTKKKND